MRAGLKGHVERHNSYTFNDAQVVTTFRVALMMGALGGGVVVGVLMSVLGS